MDGWALISSAATGIFIRMIAKFPKHLMKDRYPDPVPVHPDDTNEDEQVEPETPVQDGVKEGEGSEGDRG